MISGAGRRLLGAPSRLLCWLWSSLPPVSTPRFRPQLMRPSCRARLAPLQQPPGSCQPPPIAGLILAVPGLWDLAELFIDQPWRWSGPH